MKKSILMSIILPLAVVTISGCVKYNGRNKDGSPKDPTTTTTTTEPPAPTTEDPTTTTPVPPPPEGSVNLFLVLGPNGLYGDQKGEDGDSKYLENTKLIQLKYGEALPDENIIKSEVPESKFLYWVDRETTEITTVAPVAEEAVLVAVFEGGGDSPIDPGNLPSEGFGFLFSDNKTYALATKFGEPDAQGREQYKVSDMNFVEGSSFRLFDFANRAGWTIPLDPWSLGGSDTDIKWTEYLAKSDTYYTVKKSFKAKDIYIKLKYEDDQLYMGLAA